MDDRERLKDLLLERSVRIGDYTLASGARSSYYVDARRTTMTAEGQCLVGRLGYAAIADTDWSPTHVGGMTLGADPVSYAIAHESFAAGSPLDAFTVRKEPKGHGTGQQIEGGLPENAVVVMIEDSITTGGSTLRAIEIVRRHGCRVAGVLTVVDRDEGAAAALKEVGVPLVSLFMGAELKEAAQARI
jgi:orotate phosphoribosyltransferase